MHRRTLLVVLAFVLAALLAAPAALGATVRVRVEGPNATIFGAIPARVTVFTGVLPVEGGDPLGLEQATALGALEAASIRGDFFYRMVSTAFGPFVSQIGRPAGEGLSGWSFKINGVAAPVSADTAPVEDGDQVLWYYSTFGPDGGSHTLDLVRGGKRCFRAFDVDDNGARTRARGVVFRLDGRAVRSAGGRICPRGHWHRLLATKPGLVRSQVVRAR